MNARGVFKNVECVRTRTAEKGRLGPTRKKAGEWLEVEIKRGQGSGATEARGEEDKGVWGEGERGVKRS